MSIRKHIEMDSQRNVYGFVNLGVANDMDGDEIQEAKNALVFLAVGINGYWKLPIGYFLIDGLNGKERANLLQKAIELLSDTGVKINSITFDGTSVNTTMVKSLGADLNTKPYIINPQRNEPIYIFLDAAHMIKLVRNAWGDKKYKKNLNGQSELVPKLLYNSQEQLIRWDYLEMLYKLECEKGLRAGTKITVRHIKYTDGKMNVRLAAQTLSQSVADALMFLKDTEPGFKNVDATVEFVTYMNNAFDILNSRSKFSIKPYNKPISEETITKYKEFTNEFSLYVQGLRFVEHKNDQPIITYVLQSNRKTGFLGLVI
uniref:THAP domain-containing protein 9 n=1 Tax=Schizaphis graminum TaxID=13262 RepID=A0A2S2NKA9_SCHGA